MLFDLMPYDQPLFRPPSEADSLILQVTLGCSHNRCSFCSMYRTKRFRPRPPRDVEREIELARRTLGPDVPRIFFADGDAMCLSTRRLLELLRPVNEAFLRVQRVGIYANARAILSKSDDELAQLASNKLRMVYIGLESGDEQTLARVDKGARVEQIVEAARRARAAGLTTSVMVLVGLGGRERSLVHARRSAEALNRMEPSFTALLTYIPTPGSPLGVEVERGAFTLPSAMESLEEIRELLQHLECSTYFTCNHASNYLPLRGRWPGARSRLLPLLDAALAGQVPIKPELLRGL